MLNIQLEIAKLIGQPIDTQLPVPYELAKIADVDRADAGEHVWRYAALDTDADVILQADTSTGAIIVKKRSPLGDTQLSFTGLNSQIEYVLVNDILNSPDTKKLARRKASISRGMDKVELKTIITLIEADNTTLKPGLDVTSDDPASGEDLYDAIMSMVHTVEDYGDNYVLLCGSAVKQAIDNFDKANVASFNYSLSINTMLKNAGIEVVKIFGQVSTVNSAETEAAIMDTNHAILVAKNSRIAQGAPIKFVRRMINSEIASLMGADVDKAERAVVVLPTPVNVAGANTLAYGTYGFESVCYFISNPKSIVKCDFTSLFEEE